MGCQMNSADSERIAGQLESMGMVRTSDALKANVVIYIDALKANVVIYI